MKKHVKNYMKAHNIGIDDVILCSCGRVAVDIHHKIKRSQGGKDDANNLIPLCRICHDKHHK